ncbi:hypothetical protein BJ165DRAFT_1534478 [Panaeolus papilionaceus]|nr:hypothetical protein BJ165DRAFT_1534478 [Panaeolus papilionaceus]
MSTKSTKSGSSKKFQETKAFFQNLTENKPKPMKTSSNAIPKPAPKRKSMTLTEKWAKFDQASEADEKAASSSKPRQSVGSKPRASTSSLKVAVKNESPPPVSSIPNTSSPLKSSTLVRSSPSSATSPLESENQSHTKTCIARGCNVQISAYHSFKRCLQCREKERLKAQLKKARAENRLLQQQQQASGVRVKTEDEDAEMQDVEAIALFGERGTKRKASPKLLSELEGDELKKAVKMMKKGVSRLIVELAIPVRAETVNSNLTEYQNARELYDSVRLALASAKPGSLAFVGHHTIIADATINNPTRARYVSRDLKRIAKLPFEYGQPISSKSDLNCPTTHIMRFKCTCLSRKKTLGAAAQQATQPEIVCGGRIKFIVSDDTTHPHVVGQKIEVRVRHGA